VRADGFAISDEEFELGLRSIAVAVPDSRGQGAVAIAVSLHAGRMTVAELIHNVLPDLQAGRQDLVPML
jgi:IclR family pca regulon transcriptional regulator